jgi:NAD-dependent dihydropyrimidine dehydrogenase PreA subunit
MSKLQYFTDVVTLKLDSTLCTGCGMCAIVCPHNVFKMERDKAIIKDIDSCMECGACSKNCRFGALSVRSGVGCAAGILNGILNNTEATCGCSQKNEKVCC